MASTKSKEIADDYVSSLSDLTINSKPLIDMLTMLAEDNVEHASTIVQAVENHLQKVRSDVRLPVLYLIDSIVKNVSGAYLKLFTENIVNTFCNVFEEVNEKTRVSMWKLRQTWDDVFPAKKLFSLDVRVKSIDPAWPITAPSPTISSGSIHLNPRFLSLPQASPTSIVSPVKMPPDEPVSVSEASMREQLLKKQRELLELQKQKIELELLQAKTSLEQQQKQLDKQTASVKAESIIPTAHVVPSTELVQGKPVAPVVPSQATKQVEKQFPAAAASLLKNAGISNGPRIAPASSLLVASARSISRDPRMKSTSASQERHNNMDMDSRVRNVALPIDSLPVAATTTTTTSSSSIQAISITTVLSDQLKQQLITKQAVTSPLNKSTLNNVSGDVAMLNASNNDNNHNTPLNINSNNKTLSVNTLSGKDTVSHRTSQKKDPRSSSNNCGNVNNNSCKLISNQLTSGPLGSLFFTAHAGSGGGGGGGGSSKGGACVGGESEIKSKESKNMSSQSLRGSSSLSGSDKSSSASSKSSHRKLGSKSRTKQPQTSSNKIPKMERDASPIRSKSREKDSSDGSSSTSSRTSPQSSSQLSKSRTKSSSKSRKRSPSPPYRIPRRCVDTKSISSSSLNNNSNTTIGGLTEEEQSGSLIVSPPHPPTFKEIRPNARQRNYIRRNKETGHISPDHSSQSAINAQTTPESLIKSTTKDEDLRPVLPTSGSTIVTTVTEKREDLDLRILPPVTNKRQSTEHIESSSKKTKAEKFDALFGNEDVDLRTLTNPKAGRPPTPPPPVISGEDNKASWAKIKTPTKNERDKQINNDDKRDRDRNKDRLGRTRLYNNKTTDDLKDRRRPFVNDDDQRPARRNRDLDKPDRHSDSNIEIIMKQAEEQLNQGSISKAEYHTLIQEVWQMNEDRKLRAAQRKEKEAGSIVWEKNLDSSGFVPDDGDLGHRGKDHPHGRNGPRWQTQPWQQPGPWAHPTAPSFGGHFPSDYRPMGPWQNSRQFGPIRPDYNQFHAFNSGMTPPPPRMGPSLLGPMVPNGPMIPSLMPNGPMGPIGLPNSPIPPLNGPPSLLMNGPHQPHSSLMGRVPTPTRNISPFDVNHDEPQNFDDKNTKEQGTQGRELSPPDPKLLEDIANDTMKSINIDGVPREIRYYGQTGVVFMSWDEPREIGFQDGIRRILVDDKDTIVCAFNDPYKEFIYDGEIHRIRLGAPTRELYVDDRWYECYFGGPSIKVDLGSKSVSIKLEGPPPQVKIGSVKRTDLVIAKINLIINARNMVPVFLDAKPQMFEIDGQPQTLEFTDALETVLLNGRPFKVEFGGLPKPIIVRDKKQFIRFSVLPRGVRAGYVQIAGMKGEKPADRSSDSPTTGMASIDPLSNAVTKVPGLEQDSTSQDASNDVASTSKPNFQLDMLSSALSSAMAPSSGLSYQAEPTEKPAIQPTPALPLNLNLNELFQRLVETGIVPKIPKTEEKEVEEESVKKEPEISPITFDKPETLKIKQPAISAVLYSGMQCSSCGARFAPELATRYSHHLDWHFRQNRREKDSARKAHSRPWYYDVGEWIQFEEIEDLEDRAQSWFEMEKQMAETEGACSLDSPRETVQPSVPTGSDEDAYCQACHDAFEQFYNEEKEEWHLRPAVSFEDNNYHPLCLEDRKRSLEKSAAEFDDSFTEQEEEEKENVTEAEENASEESANVDDSLANERIESEQKESVGATTSELIPDNTVDEPLGDNIIEETSTEVQPVTQENNQDDDNKENDEKKDDDNMEVTADEQLVSKLDTDVNIDTVVDAIETPIETKTDVEIETNVFETLQTIKQEPEDEEVEMEWQPDINIEIKTEPIDPEPEPEETVTDVTALVDTTLTAVKSSIDGNVEHDSSPPVIPAAPSRIKINITKVIVSKEPEEPKEKVPTVNTPTEENNTPLVPASIKPTLRGRKLSNMPPVTKDSELSGLCSIM